MRVTEVLSLALLQATAVVSTPLDSRGVKPSKCPNHPIKPHHPAKQPPLSAERNKTCIVENARGSDQDDSDNILKAIKSCNNGGHVVFPKDQSYTVGTALDLQFLKHIDLGMCDKS
jgi:galacturan 1,4-alpha-galacturonidase